jgi:hypothetical protein
MGFPAVHSEVAGSDSAVVFTHDGLTHSESWDEQFEVFAENYRVAVAGSSSPT